MRPRDHGLAAQPDSSPPVGVRGLSGGQAPRSHSRLTGGGGAASPRSKRLLVSILFSLSACAPAGKPTDLLRPDAGLIEAKVAGRDLEWVKGQTGKQVRLNDDVRRTLPASPPSRLRFRLDVPPRASLSLSCGIPPERQDRPGVEFVVSIVKRGREQTLWSLLLDPARRPAHRKWVHAEVDLAKHAGQGVELILETRGFEAEDDPRRALWGTPVIQVASREAPLVIVYLVDTLRADHTTPYGYERDTTPHLLEFAKDGVVFDAAIAQASWTKPSVASLMTSLLPGRHRAVQLRDPLDSGHLTLAEMLHSKGYATGAMIANSVIYSQGSNFEQGFDVFTGLHGAGDRPSKLVHAAGVVDAALAWLETRAGLPTFLYIHTMDPHVPYEPPPPFDRKFDPPPTPSHPGIDPRTDYKEPLDRDRLIAQYDGDIAYGDQEFGRFVEELKARGLYDRAFFLFTADHGEEFLDHGKWLHGRSVFDELVRVPLIVKFPRGAHAGTRVRQMVQEIDVLPTILQNEGLPLSDAFTGRPLQAVIAGRAPEAPAVSEISHRGNVAFGMRTGRDKYIRRFSPEEDELYFDLVQDPKEKQNRYDPAAERVRRMKENVEAAMVPNPFRHNLRVVGSGEYVLKVRTGGWIEGVEPTGLDAGERYQVEGNGRKLALLLRPRPGQPRGIAFSVRPTGVPVWLEGTRDGRPLRPGDVRIAGEGAHPPAAPFSLPEIEPHGENENAPTLDVLTPPPADLPGLHLWLVMSSGRNVLPMDKATCERLLALGYLGGGGCK